VRLPPNRAALYRRHAERLRAIAQQSALAQTKLLLLNAVLYLEERAMDEDYKLEKVYQPAPRAREQ
jgi:formate dehydrogenase maturation protein FdhE